MTALGGIFLGAMLVASAASQPPSIEVFTTARYLIGTTDLLSVEVYRLDAPAALEVELSATLPPDPERASQFARSQIQDAWLETAEALTRAYQGLLKAQQYGLQKFPAVVFDGQTVVYGVVNLEQALGDYRRWQAGSP